MNKQKNEVSIVSIAVIQEKVVNITNIRRGLRATLENIWKKK